MLDIEREQDKVRVNQSRNFLILGGPVFGSDQSIKNCSVADPGCLSQISDPDIYPSQIPDLTTAPKWEGEFFVCCTISTIVCSLKYHKL
jgi:hypothetical protein